MVHANWRQWLKLFYASICTFVLFGLDQVRPLQHWQALNLHLHPHLDQPCILCSAPTSGSISAVYLVFCTYIRMYISHVSCRTVWW